MSTMVTYFTPSGEKYKVLERVEEQLRIPLAHINSTIYLYGSVDTAQKSIADGGSGFLIAIPNPLGGHYIYAVTNVHVIAHCGDFPVIRLNKVGGGWLFVTTPQRAWKPHPEGDDISVCQIELPDGCDAGAIQPSEFVTPQNLEMDNYHIGPGDNTYMIGRFTTHEGKKFNTPIVRFGNISLNPNEGDKIHNNETGHDDEVFLVDSRSVSGYSGSAVFTFILPFDERGRDTPQPNIVSPDTMRTHPFLLGINIGHTRLYRPVVMEDDASGEYANLEVGGKKLQAEYNSGIMRIAPAWKLQQLLNNEEFEVVRKEDGQKRQDKTDKSHTSDTAEPNYSRESLTKEEFENSLKKVSRKINPSESDKLKDK